MLLKIDELAERILTLGHTPEHRHSIYATWASITETEFTTDDGASVEQILHSFAIVISQQRSLLAFAQATNDEGTNALMSDYIRQQEKLVWMYTAFLK